MEILEWKIRANKQITTRFRKRAKLPIRDALISFFTESSVEWTHAYTGTFQSVVKRKSDAEKYVRKFSNSLNTLCGLPNANRKAKKDMTKRLPMMTVIEGGSNGIHLHCHFLLATPKGMTNEEFEECIRQAWKQTGNGSRFFNELKPLSDTAGWVDYIAKEVTSESTDAVNWQCTHVYRETLKGLA
jgi:hypothetical protein